ncbi:hypothetical protein nbrc107696_40670 [Gordonia spumicola]|uniref:Uncharacterized protein n=1 Tax=Gordonia spumicola TaxID=589161 RepID=A0A7I9VEN4_9ACTN|nr:hypothetical protein nbrc107696_40670 [Gordonia spumicola]
MLSAVVVDGAVELTWSLDVVAGTGSSGPVDRAEHDDTARTAEMVTIAIAPREYVNTGQT